MTTEKTFYIIRHGETDLNKRGIVQGRGVDTSLNEMGKKQAKAFYKAYRHISFDKIYISSLQRTKETVSYFLEKGIPHEILADLDEISWGMYEGKETSHELRVNMYNLIQQWGEGHTHLSTPEGESPNDVYARLQRAITYILSQNNEQTILMCIHGRTLRILLCLLTQTPLSKMDIFEHHNTVLYMLTYQADKWQIVSHCNTEHLLLVG